MGYYDQYGNYYEDGEGYDETELVPPGRGERNLKTAGILLVVALVGHVFGWWGIPFLPRLSDVDLPEVPVVQANQAGPASAFDCGNGITVISDPNPIQQTKKTLWRFLKSQKLSDNQAAGIMGNIQAEAGFRLHVEESTPNVHGTRGYGMAQWTGPRRTNLVNEAGRCKKPTSDLTFQIFFLYKELQERDAFDRSAEPDLKYDQHGNQWSAVATQGSVEDATVAFHHLFEQSHLMNKGSGAAAAVKNARGPLAYGILREAQAQKW